MKTDELKAVEGEGADLLKDYLGNPEAKLDPELEAYRSTLPSGMVVIKHPLVYSYMHHEMFNDRMNRMLEQKTKHREEALAAKKWTFYIALHERPWRLNAFTDICDLMDDKDYWHHLGATWVDSDNIWENEEAWTFLLSSDRSHRECLMDEEDREFLSKQTGLLTVYRGFNLAGREVGMSYTLDRAKAEWFAGRYANAGGLDPQLITATVEAKDVLAFFNDRDEQEIVVFQESLTTTRTERL